MTKSFCALSGVFSDTMHILQLHPHSIFSVEQGETECPKSLDEVDFDGMQKAWMRLIFMASKTLGWG